MWYIVRLMMISLFLFGQSIFITETCLVRRLTTPEELVAQAYTIVRIKAIDYEIPPNDDWHYQTNGIPHSIIRFKVEEVLKGGKREIPNPLLVNGYLSQDDGFNNAPSPYDIVGRNSPFGSCYAHTYKQNGTFLLFLNDEYTPYYTPLAPVNEQLHLPLSNDKWLLWVKKQVASDSSKTFTDKFITSRANKLQLFFF